MHKIIQLVDIRVAVVLLILTAGSFAAPSQASGDKPAAVLGKDTVLPAAPVDEVEEVVSDANAAVSAFDPALWTDTPLGGIDRDVFALALASAERAIERGVAAPPTVAVIDFTVPSTEPRMFVYDLRTRELLFEEHVSHGRNSGHNLPTKFSNVPESYQSSIGLYRAAESYVGKHGYSLRLDGLEKGFNDRARERAIVIHGAGYVNGATAKGHGRLGRSLGCPAVRPEISRSLIDALKDGGLVFAYYPDPSWMNASTYLN